ncbi:MAG TPA: peptide chain release factor N(5)-glutamine methyltransferase [Candidatus Omnitrophota bacterium]|nr:peptide chain release factor N(5)-glutamine methyltransferase [Candidatus Omnitrophota bacterium]HPS36549.1 peptide chain release factor N(5)-glutamine methyltransferase [Candidatus Omnitrophota bacterium]
MKISEALQRGTLELLNAGIDEAKEECERILMKLMDCSRSQLYLEPGQAMDNTVQESFWEILESRKRRIPLAYLLREAHFGKETLYVDKRCLIPRPETEILVEQVLKTIKMSGKEIFSFLDIGTGSGAIAVAILRACEGARGTLLDASGEALEVTRENIAAYRLRERARLVQGDLFGGFSEAEKWDLIVSNPPYLAAADWENVQEELKFEPRQALDGGKDGLDFYRKIIAGAKRHLLDGGTLALEVGLGQAEQVSKWLRNEGYDNIQRFRDYSGIERVIIAIKAN